MSLQSRTFEIGPGACRYEDNFLVETPLRSVGASEWRGVGDYSMSCSSLP
jgi:hypothetical protein